MSREPQSTPPVAKSTEGKSAPSPTSSIPVKNVSPDQNSKVPSGAPKTLNHELDLGNGDVGDDAKKPSSTMELTPRYLQAFRVPDRMMALGSARGLSNQLEHLAETIPIPGSEEDVDDGVDEGVSELPSLPDSAQPISCFGPRISLQAMKRLLEVMKVTEEQQQFYTTWVEIIASQASDSTVSSKVVVDIGAVQLEHHVLGDAETLIKLCTKWVRTCELPIEGLSQMYSVHNFVQTKHLELWCRIEAPRGVVKTGSFDAGFSMNAAIAWRIVNRLMPFDNEFAPCRSFLSYSQKEFRCVQYRCSLFPDEPEYGFSFGLETSAETSAEAKSSKPSFRPFVAAFGFFRNLMHRSANGEFSGGAPMNYNRPSGYIGSGPGENRGMPPRSPEPEAVTRLKSLTDLEGDVPIPLPTAAGTGVRDDSSLGPQGTKGPAVSSVHSRSPSGPTNDVFAKATRGVDQQHIEYLCERCSMEDVTLNVFGRNAWMTRISASFKISKDMNAKEICRSLASGSFDPEIFDLLHSIFQTESAHTLICEVNPEALSDSLHVGFRGGISKSAFAIDQIF